ncbi:MAG: primosomal protein N', partial [Ardenticatenales bacterium]
MRDWPYAEVVVDVPTEPGRPRTPTPDAPPPEAFTYAIPSELAADVHVGSAVRVPFGRQRLIGIVVGLAARTDLQRVRAIEAVVDPVPWLTPAGVALARYVSRYYIAPLFACIQPMLPPGVQTAAPRRFRRTDAPPPFDADPAVLALVGAFGRTRMRPEPALRKAAGPRRYAAAVAAALAAGLIVQVDDAPPTSARKPARWARALVDVAAAVDARLAAVRPSPTADALAWLRRPDIVLPSAAELKAATGADARTIAKLVAADLVVVASPAAATDAPVAADAILLQVHGARARAAEHALRRTTAHVEALAYIAAHGGAAPAAAITRETAATAATLNVLAEAGLIALVHADPTTTAAEIAVAETPPPLTDDQAAAWAAIVPLLDGDRGRDRRVGDTGSGDTGAGDTGAGDTGAGDTGAGDADAIIGSVDAAPVALVHGVTGSGKTELYLRAIARLAARGRQTIVLVPEIALTPQMVDRFSARFPGRVGLWHSEMTPAERRAAWHAARAGAVDVVVGSRSAIFSPLPNVGLIVVDEEHADAYKQDRTPRYHARDVGIARAGLEGAAVILGSATPNVTSYWKARRGVWTLIELPRRVVAADPRGAGAENAAAMGELPPVRIVDMRSELRVGNTSVFSRPLLAALQHTLLAGEQAILFLNRRGTATFVQCRDCGHVQTCPRCDAPLTQHVAGLDEARRGRVTARLVCHACGHTEAPPMLCPACASTRIRYVGLGTERLERETQAAFPGVRTLRWDADTTDGRGAHAALLARFSSGQADVLIGTQMITKGLDLPLVTLVGVVSADTALHFPDYRASERAFQLLSQVAGRAGRSAAGGQVILQTYNPDHPAITYAARHDFAGFYTREIAFRAQHGYPPWRPLWRLLWVTEQGDAAALPAATAYAQALRDAALRLGLPYTDVLGPAPAFFHRLRGRYRWQILLSSPEGYTLLAAAPPPGGWRVDVDAVDVL